MKHFGKRLNENRVRSPGQSMPVLLGRTSVECLRDRHSVNAGYFSTTCRAAGRSFGIGFLRILSLCAGFLRISARVFQRMRWMLLAVGSTDNTPRLLCRKFVELGSRVSQELAAIPC